MAREAVGLDPGDVVSNPADSPASGPPIRDDDGYYHMPDGQRLMSVTTILQHGVPKPNLVHWAAWEVARCAMDYLPRMLRARGEEERRSVLGWLQKAAERKRDDASDMGIAIHDIAEAYILGKPCPEPNEDQAPFVEAFARFCRHWNPCWEAAEMVVANYTHGYAGKADIWVDLTLPDAGPGPVRTIVDIKTGKNYYPEVAMQLSAYNNAEVGFLRDGTQITPPRATHGAVLHLRPSRYSKTGGYRLVPVDISDETFKSFLNAQRTAVGWVKGRSVTVLGKPYPEPELSLREVG